MYVYCIYVSVCVNTPLKNETAPKSIWLAEVPFDHTDESTVQCPVHPNHTEMGVELESGAWRFFLHFIIQFITLFCLQIWSKIIFFLLYNRKVWIYLSLKVLLNVKVALGLSPWTCVLPHPPSLAPHVLARINNNSRIKGRLLRRPSIQSKTHTVTLILLIC